MKISIKLFAFVVAIALFVSGCNDDENVSSPAASTIQVDKTSGLVGDTEFKFTVSLVNASAIAILPKGVENPNEEGILLTASQFSGSSATISYTYDEPGQYKPVVVTTNYSLDGKNVKQSVSAPLSVNISSNKKAITEFSFAGSTKTVITEGAGTIAVTVPYDPYGIGTAVKSMKATFANSTFSTVKVGSVEQKSGETANDFSSPVTYTVTANDGSTKSYVVTVTITPVETLSTIKSFGAKESSKSTKDKAIVGSVDNTNGVVVLYDTLGTPSTSFDSLKINYELDGKFAKLLDASDKDVAQDALLNLTTSKQLKVKAQDGTVKNFSVYAVAAPKLTLAFNGLLPTVSGANTNFGIGLNVLKGTDVATLVTTAAIATPAGVTVTSMKADGVAFVSGGVVDFTEPVEFELTVNDTNIGKTYKVIYTAKVTVLP